MGGESCHSSDATHLTSQETIGLVCSVAALAMGRWRIDLCGLLGTAHRLRPRLLRVLILNLFRARVTHDLALLTRVVIAFVDTNDHALVGGVCRLLLLLLVLDCRLRHNMLGDLDC